MWTFAEVYILYTLDGFSMIPKCMTLNNPE